MCLTRAIFPHRKDIPAEHVTHADREQTKKVVYSVVYGAGRLGCWSWPVCTRARGARSVSPVSFTQTRMTFAMQQTLGRPLTAVSSLGAHAGPPGGRPEVQGEGQPGPPAGQVSQGPDAVTQPCALRCSRTPSP